MLNPFATNFFFTKHLLFYFSINTYFFILLKAFIFQFSLWKSSKCYTPFLLHYKYLKFPFTLFLPHYSIPWKCYTHSSLHYSTLRKYYTRPLPHITLYRTGFF
jgi:hypothetical protein